MLNHCHKILMYQNYVSSSRCTRTSYRQISWSLEAARSDVIMIVSLWHLTGISAALLSMCQSNLRAIGKFWTRISRLRDFKRFYGKASVRFVNRGPDLFQFERNSLDAALYLLDMSYLGTEAHGNPIKVTRALSALVSDANINHISVECSYVLWLAYH